MTEDNIKKSWRNLLIPFILGVTIFIASFMYHEFGNKKPTPQTISLLGCVLGLVFMIFSGKQIFSFKKYLKTLNK